MKMDGDELIKTIDKLYFEDEDVFNLNHLTEKLPSKLTSDYLLDYKVRLERLLAVVTRKVSELILSHQPTYVDELQRIANLQKSITDSIRVCTQGRSCLRYIKDGTARNGSIIVEHYRKRESLAKLLDGLQTISNLRKSVFEIRSLIDKQEDFPRAIQKCKDGQAILTSFNEYKCVNELGSKLNYTIELIGEQVDTVLLKMCLSYSSDIYTKLQTSYGLMDRSEIAVDQLLMHFCSTINSQAHNIVIKYLTSEDEQPSTDDLKQTANESQSKSNLCVKLKRDFQELCKMLTQEQYLPCLLELCTTYWLIMLNYKRILEWHGIQEATDDAERQTDNAQDEFKATYIRQKLLGGLNRLWYDMKRKLSLLILNHDLNGYRFDEFIKILSIVDLVIHIGDEFCGGPSSEDLKDCINVQALNFFKSYHKSSMDELTMFLENEIWDVVPVKNDFKLVQLKEFSFLRTSNNVQSVKLASYQDPRGNFDEPVFFTQELIEAQDSNQDCSGLPEAASTVIPFEKILQSSRDTNEDLFGADMSNSYYQEEPLPLDKISLSTDSDDDLDSELNKDCVEEDGFISSEEEQVDNLEKKEAPGIKQETNHESCNPSDVQIRYSLTHKSGPVLTNSSLNVLRLFGKYIQMMSVLEPISYEILMHIYNLLDYYITVVYKRFGPDSDKKSDDKNLSPKLKVVIRSIRESLIGNQPIIDDPKTKSGDTNISVQQPLPNITNIITHDFIAGHHKSERLSVDSKKAVAVESLIFLVNQLWNLQEYLESLIPDHLRPRLREQFSQCNSSVPDFLKARAAVDMENFHSST